MDINIDRNKIREYDLAKNNILISLGIKLITIPELFVQTKLEDLTYFIQGECEKLGISLKNNLEDLTVDISHTYNTNSISKYAISAQERGGNLMVDTFINSQKKCEWQCAKGHTWWAAPTSVVNGGNWCPQCLKLDINVAQEIAKQRGGKCLSTEYVNTKAPMSWECNTCSTVWVANLGNIKNRGTWCPQCNKNWGYNISMKEARC
jgi:Zn finger protein HypA/HybF involved in hydrogenase expression